MHTRHLAAIGNNQTVAAGKAGNAVADIKITAVGPERAGSSDHPFVAGGIRADVAGPVGQCARVGNEQGAVSVVPTDASAEDVGRGGDEVGLPIIVDISVVLCGGQNTATPVCRVGPIAEIGVEESLEGKSRLEKQHAVKQRGEGDGAFHRGLLSGRA